MIDLLDWNRCADESDEGVISFSIFSFLSILVRSQSLNSAEPSVRLGVGVFAGQKLQCDFQP